MGLSLTLIEKKKYNKNKRTGPKQGHSLSQISIHEDIEKSESSYTVGANIKWCSYVVS